MYTCIMIVYVFVSVILQTMIHFCATLYDVTKIINIYLKSKSRQEFIKMIEALVDDLRICFGLLKF